MLLLSVFLFFPSLACGPPRSRLPTASPLSPAGLPRIPFSFLVFSILSKMFEFSSDPSNSHLPSFLGSRIAALSFSSGIASDQIRLMICLLAALPLGFFHKMLPNATSKHLFSFVLGFWYAYFVVGLQALHVLAFSLFIYFLARVLPRNFLAVPVFFLSLAYLSSGHLYRQITDYGGYSLDVTLVQMVLVVKFVTFSYNWADGQALNKGETLSEKPHIHQSRAESAVRKCPSLLEYLSFIWCYSGVLVGPCFEIRPYLEFTDLSMFHKAQLKEIPSTIIPSLLVLGRALTLYAGVFVSGLMPIQGFMDTDEYFLQPFYYRFSYMFVATLAARCKYYFVWYLAEAGMVSSGLSFNGVSADSRQPLWDRIRNVYHFRVELATSMPQFTNNWNLGVNNWLKHYVYFRLERPRFLAFLMSQKMYSNILTKLTSAFWHGFYPSYYLFFLGAVFVNEMDDALRANIEPYFHKKDPVTGKSVPSYPKKYIYDVFAWFLLLGHMNYLGSVFILLEVEKSLRFFKSFGYFIFWFPVLVILITKPFKPRSEKKSTNPAPASPKAELIAGAAALATSNPPVSEGAVRRSNRRGSENEKAKEEIPDTPTRRTRSKKAE